MSTEILSSQPVTIEQPVSEYAGFWRRFVANLLDSLIICAAIGLLILIAVLIGLPVFKSLLSSTPPTDDPTGLLNWELRMWPFIIGVYAFECIAISGVWLYYALQESGPHQATFGKRAMSIVVTDAHGYPITFGRATGRYFAKCLSSMTLGIGYIMAGFTEQKQALHDMVASTLVLRK